MTTRSPRPTRRSSRRRATLATLAMALVLALVPAGVSAAPADEDLLAFGQTPDGGDSFRIMRSAPDGSGRRRVSPLLSFGRPSFSPDGRRVAFSGPLVDYSLGRYSIFVAGVNGGRPRRLTTPAVADLDPAWSPDGEWIAFTRDYRGNLDTDTCCAIAVMRADGSGERIVPGTQGGSHPSWSPDSQLLVYQHPAGLKLVSRDGAKHGTLARGNYSEPAWSPDGQHIAAVRHLSGARDQIVVMGPGGGNIGVRVSMRRSLEAPRWGHDNLQLFFVAYNGVGYDGRRNAAIWESQSYRHRPRRRADFRGNVFHVDHHAPRLYDAVAVAGDWNGDGTDTVGVVMPVDGELVWHLANRNRAGSRAATFVFGRRGDVPVAGDWDGDGRDTIGVRRGNQWLLRNRNSAGPAHRRFRWGNIDDIPIVGNWDGRGGDSVGLRRGRAWFLRNLNSQGPTHHHFRWGADTDVPVTGDWDDDGRDTVGIRRGIRWFLLGGHRKQRAERRFRWGSHGDLPVSGDWNDDGRDTVGLRRQDRWFLNDQNNRSSSEHDFRWGPLR